MHCRNCANPVDERAVACLKCGLNPRAGVAYCQACGQPSLPNAATCPACGVLLARAAAIRDPRADKKIPAGICGILLGSLGIHKFILGYTYTGILMLLLSTVGGFITCFISSYAIALIGLIEGIVYLTKSDEEFVNTYVVNERQWF